MARRGRRRSSRRQRDRDYDDDRGGRGGRGRGGGGGGGVPVPAIVGGVGLLVVLVGVFAMSGGGGTKGPGGGAVKKAAKAYLDAWKSGSVDSIIAMESISKSKADSLVARYKRKHDSATSGVRHAKDIRGKVERHQLALFEMDDEIVKWGDSNKIEVAKRVLEVSYKAYFHSGTIPLTYSIKGVSSDGDAATVRVSIKTDTGKDCPELVPLEDMMRNKEIKMVKKDGRWLVKRDFN